MKINTPDNIEFGTFKIKSQDIESITIDDTCSIDQIVLKGDISLNRRMPIDTTDKATLNDILTTLNAINDTLKAHSRNNTKVSLCPYCKTAIRLNTCGCDNPKYSINPDRTDATGLIDKCKVSVNNAD